MAEEPSTSEALVRIARELSAALGELRFSPPVACVYDPLRYAWEPHEAWLRRYGEGTGRVVLVGMNPGPFGMAQTGVPFGEVAFVAEWMGIRGRVDRPDPEHPKRPVEGFGCGRSEVSGSRLWGWAREAWGSPEAFFERFFVVNWCPLCFLEDSGRNRTPDKIRADERAPLYALCDAALRAQVEVLKPSHVVGVGAFAEARAREALAGLDVPIGRVLHPSPASPAANRGWQQIVEAELAAMGVEPRPSAG